MALFAKGRSGVRLELVESLLARLQSDDLPTARLGSSVGASDIVAMSQLALPLLGKRGVSHKGTGPRPLDGLAAKEAVSLLNSNCLMLSAAALAIGEVRLLLDAAMLAGALSLEGFRASTLGVRRSIWRGASRANVALARSCATHWLRAAFGRRAKHVFSRTR